MIWVLKQNSNIIAFPEGTTTRGDVVLAFHPSLFQSALMSKSAIQPVALQYQGIAKQQVPFVGDDDFIPHLIKLLSLDKIEVRICFLSPLKNSGRDDRHSVSAEAREMILEAISADLVADNFDHLLIKSSL